MASLKTAPAGPQCVLNSATHTRTPTNRAKESNRRRRTTVTSTSIARNLRRSSAIEDRSSHSKIKSKCLLALVAFALLQCSACLDPVNFLPSDNSKMRLSRRSSWKASGVPLDLAGGFPVSDPTGESERAPHPSTFLLARTLSFDSSDQPWPKAAPYQGEPPGPRDWRLATDFRRSKFQRRPPKLSRCVERN